MFYERHIEIIAVTVVIKVYTIIFPDQEDLVDDRMKKNSSSNDCQKLEKGFVEHELEGVLKYRGKG
jgi:hypothetical protein